MPRIPITIPDLGAGHETIRISNWYVEIGDTVEIGDRVVELLVPGITFDVAGEAAGVLVEITRDVHAVVEAEDVVGWIACET